MLQILGDISDSLENSPAELDWYQLWDGEEMNKVAEGVQNEEKEGDLVSTLASAKLHIEHALEGDSKIAEIIAKYEKEQEMTSSNDQETWRPRWKVFKQHPPLHYFARFFKQ